MKWSHTAGLTLAAALLVGSAIAEEALKSGPQPGKVCTPFNPLHMNGPDANKRVCLV
jgi:hypothetical protein